MSVSNEHTDGELAALLREGDEFTFRLLYERFWPRMYAVARKRLNDAAEAEEVVQDIFLRLWKKRATFALRAGFEQYLATAVKFEVITRRARRVREAGFIRELTAGRTALATIQPLDLEELRQQLEQTVNSLPPKCRLVFRMKREGDYTNKKLALELGISEKAVEKHITHALKVLRTRFGNYLPVLLLLLQDLR